MDTVDKIKSINSFKEEINIMEVCGTHTMAISKFGLRNLFNDNIKLISGPGCPVCVTPDAYLDYVYDLALKEDVLITTYGDMLRVPGSRPEITLENAKALGANVKMVYSSMDALEIAKANPFKKVVFLGIGFETTTPAAAIAIKEAYENSINNFYVLSLHKIVEPVMRTLLEDKELKIEGFLCPGHVAAIIGEDGFKFLEEYNCTGVITGFELDEIVDGIYTIINNYKNKNYVVDNCYRRLVRENGNKIAIDTINEVFEVKNSNWRGIGVINDSGLRIKEKYSNHDIEKVYPINENAEVRNNGCSCGEILKGKLKPNECKLFGKVCTPENPVGPCMVSMEGSCSAYYKYNY